MTNWCSSYWRIALTEETRKLLLADLKRDEGRKDRPYRDSRGILTIGYGHNLEAAPLCEAALQAQLDYDLTAHLADLDVALPWWRQQPEPVQRVIANLAYNIGESKLIVWRRTLGFLRPELSVDEADALAGAMYWLMRSTAFYDGGLDRDSFSLILNRMALGGIMADLREPRLPAGRDRAQRDRIVQHPTPGAP